MKKNKKQILMLVVLIAITGSLYIYYSIICTPPSILCSLPPTQDEIIRDSYKGLKLKVSTITGKTPLTVRVIAPEELTIIQEKRLPQGRAGCVGTSINWGDTTDTTTSESICSDIFEHTYTKAGTYTVKGEISRITPTDGTIVDWSDEVTITVE